jgi:chromosome segregation ATPase
MTTNKPTLNLNNQNQDALLEVMLLKSLEQADQIREHVEGMRDKMTELRLALNNVQVQGRDIPEAVQKIRSLDTKTQMIEKDINNIENALKNLQHDIQKIRSSAEEALVEANKKTKDSVKSLEDKIITLEKKVDDVRSQQAKWVGALGVLGVIFTLLVGMLKDYFKLKGG